MSGSDKAAGAFRTIGEVATATGVAPHVLRYWETRFPQLRPITRAGNRRYYRPEDVALVERIQRLLATEGDQPAGAATPIDVPGAKPDHTALISIRDRLQRALEAA